MDFWEERYGSSGQVWSGRVNATTAAVVAELEATGVAAGTALDLGCGEGGDALWLAQRGWRVTGLDISPTAISRARDAAAAAGLDEGHARFVATDLSSWLAGEDGAGPTTDTVDLVTASFFHSPVLLPRSEILAAAAGLVAPGGHLLLVTHAVMPPWAKGEDAAHHADLLSPDEEVEALALDPTEWEVLLVETRRRQATGPDGQPALLDDGVVLARRIA
ncbi:class I SAM-dependent methyltransferase [Cnuibacter sp. UC19_7]|uniref:class I SAM-dependent methyltransferase n=1 Tax=Cnuibacter sp. UC19_7 TaxID=3350166 RepID=UPI00366D642F